MLGSAIELAINSSVTHDSIPCFLSATTVRRTLCSGGLPAFARKKRAMALCDGRELPATTVKLDQ